ncbi:hypothetical protein LXA43DRAFT_1105676 [Ganoderma leucocontextum]|nr:hypothetical protein LXA43DRAFT_1105676 [Ganoderma leucocontextum]
MVALPPKIFNILAPAIKGHKGVAREIKFQPFINVLASCFGCTLDQRKGNLLKVTPPLLGHGMWYWARLPFFVHKPVNGTLSREDLFKLQKTFKELYGWDHTTVVRGPGRD